MLRGTVDRVVRLAPAGVPPSVASPSPAPAFTLPPAMMTLSVLPRSVRSSVLAALVAIPGAVPASASCGLHVCPRPVEEDAPAFSAGVRTRATGFEVAGVTGWYAQVSPRVEWRPGRFVFAAEGGWVRLERDGGEAVEGLANAVVNAAYARRVAPAWTAEAGLQLELPVGDDAKGLADDHVMLLPWLGAVRDFGPAWRAAIRVGYAQAAEAGSHHHGASGDAHHAAGGDRPLFRVAHEGHDHGDGSNPVLVNAHGDRELHLRAGVSRRVPRGAVEVFVAGQSDLSDDGRLYGRAGVEWGVALAGPVGLRLSALVPVTAARRETFEAGAAVQAGW